MPPASPFAPRAVHPSSDGAAFAPGIAQATVLVSCICFPVMATSLLGPVLPAMERHFTDVPQVQTLIPVMLTIAILSLAVFSAIAGIASDRFGRRRLLLASLALYGLAGTAPLYLESLYLIIVSRVLVGAAEAGIVACSSALIGDYFHGPQRVRYMALQTTVASLSAMVFNGVGGVLGEMGWRVPFWVYGLAFAMCALVAAYIRETKDDTTLHALAVDSDPPGITFRPGLLVWICLLAAIGGAVFLMLPVHFSYLLVERGISSPGQIGLAYAINSLSVALGTVLFGWYLASRWRVSAQLALCTTLASAGLLVMAGVGDYTTTVLGSAIHGIGCGILLPMLVTWNMRELPYARRGLGLGAFFSCNFLGSFLNPLIVVPMAGALGSRGAVISVWGTALAGAAAVAACVAAWALFNTNRRRDVHKLP